MVKEIIRQTEHFVKETLKDAEGGHDWWHIWRVWNMARKIAQTERCNMLVVELASLLHDIADAKFHNGNEEIGPELAQKFLRDLGVEKPIIEHVIQIMRNISFKGGHISSFRSIEFDIVQDADRLDAIGAIGVARAFNYGGFMKRPLYNPEILPDFNMSREEYKKSLSPTLNHFNEKLFKLKDLMNTNLGRKMAINRHAFLMEFYSEFKAEWEGQK